MTIRLTKANEAAHKRLSVLIFGEPKVGKTTLAKTLPVTDDSKLLYVAADPGQLALRDRGFVVAQPSNGDLTESFFDEVREHIRTNGKDYEWIFVDGVDEVAEAILKSKMRTQRDGRKAYGEMADYVESWMKAIRDVQGTSVVFVTHIEQRDAGEGEIEHLPMFPGKQIQSHVNEWFDLIGCMRLVRHEGSAYQRYIQFRREADWRYVVGDRSGVTELYEKPDLGALFKKIHEAGFVTRGEWAEPKISDADLKALAAYGKEHNKTTDEIKTLVSEKFGKGVRDLTVSELEGVRKEIAA
jgi:hypothetical protein